MITAIEALFALFQEPVKMVRLNAVELTQMPLCPVPKIFFPIDMIALFDK